MNPAIGTVLNNRYTLTEHIATGGMGEVWAATDTVLGRTVAVKLLSAALSQQSGFLDRFRAEARHSAALHHPNITTVFDYGEDDGSAYLVMERVTGLPLSQIISERAPLSAQETASILIQAAHALEAAHQGGVVHRDVKPANILITPDGTAKLTDFGISRLVDTAPVTQTGQILGTAQYLSPEQAMGKPATASSDVYALGVVGQEMLTGQRPFEADTIVATALAHINEPPPQLPATIPVGIRSVISAALAKDPGQRPESASVMAQALGMPDVPFSAQGPNTGSSADTMVLPESALGAAGLGAAGLGAAALGASALGAGGQGGTQVIPASSPAPRTQAMSPGAADQPLPPDGSRSGRRGLLMAATAIVVLLGLAAAALFLLPRGGEAGTNTPAVPSSPPQSATSSPAVVAPPPVVPTVVPTPEATAPAVPSPAVTTPVETTPLVTTPAPRQENKGKGKGNGDDRDGDEKDGN